MGSEHAEHIRPVAQRRAVLAERLMIDLSRATTPSEAGSALTRALTTVGGALHATIVQRDPDGEEDGPALVLASDTAEDGEPVDVLTLSDREAGLELTVTRPMVPPLAITRSLRAMRATLERLAEQRQLLVEARTDPLTGLINRRALDERIESELARTIRAGGNVSLLLVDLDGFKAVNDEFGHQVGDKVLASVALAMLRVARAADDLGRLGGDEFALLLPSTDAAGAMQAAERLRVQVRDTDTNVTASIGVATCTGEEGCTATTLLRDADEALYAAKHAGRDRAVHADSLRLTSDLEAD